MSTIVVVKKDGVAAIAADTMTSGGAGRDSALCIVNHSKLVRVRDSWLGIAGPTSAKAILADYFSTLKGPVKLRNTTDILKVWLKLHKALKDKYFLESRNDPDACFQSSAIDVLIANPAGIFGVTEHRTVQEFSMFYSYGSGSHCALGAMFALYHREGLSAVDIATAAVHAAAEFDDGTGLPLLVQTVQLVC